MCMGENKMDKVYQRISWDTKTCNGNKRKEKSIGEVLSEHEKEVIKVYRQLSEDNKLTIDILIMRLRKHEQEVMTDAESGNM